MVLAPSRIKLKTKLFHGRSVVVLAIMGPARIGIRRDGPLDTSTSGADDIHLASRHDML